MSDFEQRRPKFIILPADIDSMLALQTAQTPHLARSPARARNYCQAWRQIEQYVKAKYQVEARIG